MTKIEKTVDDYRSALEERESKFRQLKGDGNGLVSKIEVDEIENDFVEDPRRKTYHDLRNQAKTDEQLQQKIMDAQRIIFNR